MKCLVVPQPSALLMVEGVKTIYDAKSPPNGPMRPRGVHGLFGVGLDRGERVAVMTEGSIIGSVVVLDALPIGDSMTFRSGVVEGDEGDYPDRRVIVRHPAMWGDDETLVMDRPYQDITDQLAYGDFAPGRWGWLLDSPTMCEPMAWRGQPGVFALPDDLSIHVERCVL